MKPGDPTGTTFRLPNHSCECGTVVRIHGQGPYLCLSAVNHGRDWERSEAIAYANRLMATTKARADIPPLVQKAIVETLRAFRNELARKAHVTE